MGHTVADQLVGGLIAAGVTRVYGIVREFSRSPGLTRFAASCTNSAINGCRLRECHGNETAYRTVFVGVSRRCGVLCHLGTFSCAVNVVM
jgi:hypothetical protein